MRQENVRAVPRKNTALKPNFTLIIMAIAAVCLLSLPLMMWTYEERKGGGGRRGNASGKQPAFFGQRANASDEDSYYKGSRGGLWVRNRVIRRKRDPDVAATAAAAAATEDPLAQPAANPI